MDFHWEKKIECWNIQKLSIVSHRVWMDVETITLCCCKFIEYILTVSLQNEGWASNCFCLCIRSYKDIVQICKDLSFDAQFSLSLSLCLKVAAHAMSLPLSHVLLLRSDKEFEIPFVSPTPTFPNPLNYDRRLSWIFLDFPRKFHLFSILAQFSQHVSFIQAANSSHHERVEGNSDTWSWKIDGNWHFYFHWCGQDSVLLKLREK